jgi:hypothetical protein
MIHEAGEGDNVKNLAVVGGCSLIGLLASVCAAFLSPAPCTSLTPSPASSSTSSPTEKQRAVERTASFKSLRARAYRKRSVVAAVNYFPVSMPRGFARRRSGQMHFIIAGGCSRCLHGT